MKGGGSGKGHPLRACAHAAPLVGDHTTAHSGTLWRNTLRSRLARAVSVEVIQEHCMDQTTDWFYVGAALLTLGLGHDGHPDLPNQLKRPMPAG